MAASGRLWVTVPEGGHDLDQAEGGGAVVPEVARRGGADVHYHWPLPKPKDERGSVCGRLGGQNPLQEMECKVLSAHWGK